MTILKTKEELERIRRSGRVIKGLFGLMRSILKPGISTSELDRQAEIYIYDNGAKPAFKGYKGFPGCICASVNEVVVHGIPSRQTVLKEGDIVGIDIGVKKDGFFTDAARTFPVGKVSDKAADLINTTRRGLEAGIKKAIAGNRLSDISYAIESVAKKKGYKEVRAFVGHGIGKELHETPEVPNWGEKGRGMVLGEGLLLAIEPMFNAGTREVKILKDGWTAVTEDRGLSAHFEDTIVVGNMTTEILT